MSYKPGLHILLNIQSISENLLNAVDIWDVFLMNLINEHKLCLVGKVLHDFDNGGYTAVHCLTESHISIHTWPEFGTCTCDIFLSNFKKDNEQCVRDISNQILKYFDSSDIIKTELKR